MTDTCYLSNVTGEKCPIPMTLDWHTTTTFLYCFHAQRHNTNARMDTHKYVECRAAK